MSILGKPELAGFILNSAASSPSATRRAPLANRRVSGVYSKPAVAVDKGSWPVRGATGGSGEAVFERRIDMDYLIFAWQDESPDNAYYLDKQTGDVELVQQGLIDLDELTDEIEMNRERYLYIPKPQPTELREDISLFAETVTDPELCRLMPVALEAPNVLPALKKVLARAPEELARWEEFRARRVRERIERWLAANFVLGRSAELDFSPPEE